MNPQLISLAVVVSLLPSSIATASCEEEGIDVARAVSRPRPVIRRRPLTEEQEQRWNRMQELYAFLRDPHSAIAAAVEDAAAAAAGALAQGVEGLVNDFVRTLAEGNTNARAQDTAGSNVARDASTRPIASTQSNGAPIAAGQVR